MKESVLSGEKCKSPDSMMAKPKLQHIPVDGGSSVPSKPEPALDET